MKILTFAASTSSQSINKQLIAYASRLLEDGLIGPVEITNLDIHDHEMPIYSVDRETEGGIPQLAHDFYDAITAADALVISFAEHNGFYTSAYKNLFDWTSRIDKRVYQGKPSVLLSASAGPGGGRNVLGTAVASGQFFGNEVRASLSIPSFADNFDTEAVSLSNPDLDAELRAALSTLATVPA